MDSKKILNRNIQYEGDKVVITEELNYELTALELQRKLQNIRINKVDLKEQNKYILNEYNKLIEKEKEIEDMIAQLNTEDIEEIEP